MERFKRRRVFILGAGVSTSCGIPVAKDLLALAVKRLRTQDYEASSRVLRLLEYFYPSFNSGLQNYPNIEDFLNLLEIAKTFNSEEYIRSTIWSPNELEKVAQITLKAVTDFIWDRIERRKGGDDIRNFVEQCLAPGDTVITFNWDLTIERAMEELDDVDFWYSPTADILLLKPHGSIDWFEKKKLPGGALRKKVQDLDDELCVFPRFDFSEYQELKKYEPVIVPPLQSKVFPWDFLTQTWRRVYRSISRATELYVIGYSLPKEDQFARLVISRALRNNRIKIDKRKKGQLTITVVNPDEDVQTAFMRLVGKAVLRFYQTTFQNFVSAIKEEQIPFP